jgi:thiol-disulfide isomerase/thioredoxin
VEWRRLGSAVLHTSWRRLSTGAAAAVALAIILAACARETCDPKVGRARLDFTLKDMNGHDVALSSFKGHPLLLNFWATWCGPCKQEIPALIELAEKYKGRQLTIVGISVDDPPEDLQKFAASHKMNYPVLVGLGHDDLLKAYEAEIGVPVSVLVTSGGCVSTRQMGGATREWFEQHVKALL